MLATDKALEKAKKAHDGYYDYPDWSYINSKSKIKIKCPIHDMFEQTYDNHVYGTKGCPKCKGGVSKSVETHIEECAEIHKRRYDYPTGQKIKNTLSDLNIICKIHGLFTQSVSNHKAGHGCPACANVLKSKSKTKDPHFFLKEANNVHDSFYEYPEKYTNRNVNLKIICPIHGEFSQNPSSHLQGSGCPKCGIKKTSIKLSKSNDEYIEDSNSKHHSCYEYVEEYKGAHVKIKIKCPIHGVFEQTPDKHINGEYGCPKCSKANISKPEIEVQDFVKSLGFEILTNKRSIIKPYELDIYLPELNKAIEFNGEYWHYQHSNKNCKPKGYHAMKSNLCRDKNIKLLHIREDLWKKDKEKMKNVIKQYINKN